MHVRWEEEDAYHVLYVHGCSVGLGFCKLQEYVKKGMVMFSCLRYLCMHENRVGYACVCACLVVDVYICVREGI